MSRLAIVFALFVCCQTARIKRRTDSLFEAVREDVSSRAPEPNALWEEYLEFADLAEMFRKRKEMQFGRKIESMGVAGMESLLSTVEANPDKEKPESFPGFEKLVKKTLDRIKDKQEREAAKEKKGASSVEKSQQRQAQKAKWKDILEGKQQCPTGVTVKFVKAATLDEALAKGEATNFAKEDTILAFDMDGTLVDMRDFYPQDMMRTFHEYAAASKVVITAADNRGGCEAVTTSLLAALPHSNMLATNGTVCDEWVKGAEYDMEDQSCTCPVNYFVNGMTEACRAREETTLLRSIGLPALQAEGAKCYCEPDLFGTFSIDPDAECPQMTTSKGDTMIAKQGVIMNRYGKAEGLNTYYNDPTYSQGKQYEQVIFFDDWVENPVNFVNVLCFAEAPPGLKHVVAVWYATDRMEEREQEKLAKLKAGKMGADNSEGNYFHPEAWNDARLAGMRIMFGVQ